MTRVIAAATSALPAVSLWLMASLAALAQAQEPRLAPEGRGLLPKQMETIPQEQPAPPYVFKADPSGGLSRTILETDEEPNFRLIIREFSFRPDRQAHTLTLPAGALVQFPNGPVEISVATKRLEAPGTSMAVPAGAPIEVLNNGEYPVGLRAIILEAK
jgi:hypothetical protein